MADGFLRLVLFACVLGVCLSVCPDGSIVHDGSCYVIFHLKTTWSEAAFFCRQLHTELLGIETSEEQQFITNYITREGIAAFNPGKFWTGGTNMMTAGNWVWEKESRPLSFANWAPSEPVTGTNEQRCLAMGFTSRFRWYNAVCENKYNFICESSPSDETGMNGLIG